MNRCFKIVFNKARGCLMVVNEITSSAQKGTGSSIAKTVLASIVGISFLGVSSQTFAGSFADGGGKIEGSDKTIAIGASKESKESATANNTLQSVLIGADSEIASTASQKTVGATAIGFGTRIGVRGNYSIAMGFASNVQEAGGIAIGKGSYVRELAENAVAIGFGTNTYSPNSLALGTNATTGTASLLSANAIAIGANARSEKNSALSLGSSAQATNNDAIALGSSSAASGELSMALGKEAKAQATQATAVGSNSNAVKDMASALGAGANAANTASTALGSTSEATAEFSTSIGSGAHAESKGSTAVGSDSIASTSQYASAFGMGAKATGETSTALGAWSSSSGNWSFAGGDQSKAYGESSIAIGKGAKSGGDTDEAESYSPNTVAIGTGSKALNMNSIALGNASNANGDSSLALGSGSNVTGKWSLAIGDNAVASGIQHAVALGSSAKATQTSSTAIGVKAEASGKLSVALGGRSLASSVGSIAIGGAETEGVVTQFTQATGLNSIAMGNAAYSTDTDSIAIGSQSGASKSLSIALGTLAKSEGRSSVSVGNQAETKKDDAIAIGNGAKANNFSGSVAIGQGAIADRGSGSSAYSVLTSSQTGNSSTGAAVSVGSSAVKRQIINVAGGSDDYDAVNVKQLKELQSTLPSISVEGKTPAGEEYVGGNILANLSTKNGKNTFDLKLANQVNLGNETESGKLIVKGSGETETVLEQDGITLTSADGTGKISASGAVFSNGISISDSGLDLNTKTLTQIEQATFTNGITLGSSGVDFKENRIQGVADATDVKDAVNFGQLKDYAKNSVTVSPVGQQLSDGETNKIGDIRITKTVTAQGGYDYAIDLANNITLGDETESGSLSFYSNGIDKDQTILNDTGLILAGATKGAAAPKFTLDEISAGGNRIQNVADPESDMDAVNKRYLGQMLGETGVIGTTVLVDGQPNVEAGAGNIQLTSTFNEAEKTNTYDLKLSNNITLGDETGSGSLKFYSPDVAAGQTILNETGLTIAAASGSAAGPKFTVEEISVGGNRIQNVADPEVDTDAVNKRYLGQMLGSTGVFGTVVTVDGQSNVEAGAGNIQLTSKVDEENRTNVYNLKLSDNLALGSESVPGSLTISGEDGKTAVLNASGLKVGETTVADNAIKLGAEDTDLALTKEQLSIGNVAVKNNVLQVGTNVFNADGLTVGDTTLRSTGLEIAGGPALSNAGLAMNSQKITGLVDGEAPDEAVNKSQLDKVASAATVVEVADNNQNLTLTTSTIEDTGAKVYTVRLTDVLSFKDEAGNSATTLGKEGLTVGNTTVADNSIKIGDLRLTGESISLGNLNFNAITNELKIGESVMKGEGFRVGDTRMDASGFHFAEGKGGPKLKADVLDMGNKNIKNLAAAVDDTEAVNFGQVKDLISQVSVEGGALNIKEGKNISVKTLTDIENKPYTEIALKDKISFQKDGHTLEMDGAGITLGKSKVSDNEFRVQENGSNSYASIKGTAIKVGTDSVNAELTQSSLRVGSSSLLSDRLVIGGAGRNGMTITQGKISAAGKSMTFSNSGIDFGEAKLTGLLDGEDVTDAATIGQLQAFYEYVESKIGGTEPVQAVPLNEKNSAKAMLKAAPLTAAPVALSAQVNAVAQEETAAIQPRADAVVYVAGKNISIQENQIGLAANIEVDLVKTKTAEVSEKVTVGTSNNAVVVADNAIYFKSETGPRISSAGIDAGNTRIQNVADAQNPTDAVNLRQLNQVGGRLMSRINDVDKRAKAGIAQAIATAGLPQAYQPGKAMAAAAGGTFGGESAIAIGVSKISDDGHWVFKGTFSGNTESKFGGSIGVGYQW